MSINAGVYQQSPDHISLINIDQVSQSLPAPCSYDGKSRRGWIGMVTLAFVMQCNGWRTLVTEVRYTCCHLTRLAPLAPEAGINVHFLLSSIFQF